MFAIRLSIHALKNVGATPGSNQIMTMFCKDFEAMEIKWGHRVQPKKREEFIELLKN